MANNKNKKDPANENRLYNPDAKYYEKKGEPGAPNQTMNQKKD
ncbi:hypothetical protein ACFO3D_18690 [Virgibacillus kekensis]|uniref:Glycogen biosynthesis protein GlgD n=1 Tax=Virgibacillus kekensis TaxID=202261 RepID=A0ABV9DRH9_9BACI